MTEAREEKAKFTPGPWLVAESHQQKGAHYSWPVRTQDRFFIEVSIIYPHGEDDLETLRATAQLVRATPDLYEALRAIKLLGHPAKDVWCFPRHLVADLEAALARAALSKAEGASQ